MNATTEQFVKDFEGLISQFPGQGLTWLESMRRRGIDQFCDLGLPHTKMEDWKYTRLRSLEDTEFRLVTEADGAANVDQLPTLFTGATAVPRIVFVNGYLRSDLSTLNDLPNGILIQSLADAIAYDPDWISTYLGGIGQLNSNPLLALNTAMMNSGVVVRVRKGEVVTTPVEMVFVAGLTDVPVAYYPRNLIVLEENSQATLIQIHNGLGVGPYFANSVTEIDVGDNAVLRHYRVQTENLEATHLGSMHARVGRDATYETFCLSAGGRVSRTEAFVRLEGLGAYCGLNGAYLMKGREHCDNTTVIEHTVPHTKCREVFKGVLDDESCGVFQGKIIVHKNAQKADGHQLSKVLLLSDKAEMDAKPELEIYADDVKCSHGATAGQLDTAALFYLRSRGIPDALARNLLIQSFMAEALDEISDENVRYSMANLVMHRLPAQCFLSEEWTKGRLAR